MEKPAWLPKRVYRHGNNWRFIDSFGRAHSLGKIDSKQNIILSKYGDVLKEIENELNQEFKHSFRNMAKGYSKSAMFTELGVKTQKDYRGQLDVLVLAIGDRDVKTITPSVIVKIHEKLSENRGKVTANRYLSVLSRVFTWGRQRDWVINDPTKKLYIKNKEKPRDRYISDLEYQLVFKFADERLKPIIEISYLCAARLNDVRTLKLEQILDEGLYIKQGKTGKAQIKEWSSSLKNAVFNAKAKQPVGALFLFGKKIRFAGRQDIWSKEIIQQWFSKARIKAQEFADENLLEFKSDFTFHDLKAKGISDYEGDKRKFSGHKTQRMVDVYDRKIEKVLALEGLGLVGDEPA